MKVLKIFIAKVVDGVVVVEEKKATVENDFVSFRGYETNVVVPYAEFCAYGELFFGADGRFSAAAKTRKRALKALGGYFERDMKEAAQEVAEFSKKLETSKKKMQAAHEIVQLILEARESA